MKEFEAIKRIDFFSSKAGAVLKRRMETLQAELKDIDRVYVGIRITETVPKRIKDYQGKTWVTRKRPFVDRNGISMAYQKIYIPWSIV